MKKAIIFLTAAMLLMTSCSEQREPQASVQSSADVPMPKGAYRYINLTDCGDGMLYKQNSCLWYYDYSSEMSFTLCPSPNCKHLDKSCSAYFAGNTFLYKDKIIEITNKSKEWSETEGFSDYAEIAIADLNGYNRSVSHILPYGVCDTFVSGDSLFLACTESYYKDGDDLYSGADNSRLYLVTLSFETLEITYTSQPIADGFFADMNIIGANNGSLYFETVIYDSSDISENSAPAVQKHCYNPESGEISACDETLVYCGDSGVIYYDGNTVRLETAGKTCKLKFDIYSPYFPLSVEFSDGDSFYFTVFGNKNSLFRLDIKDNSLYEAKHETIEYPDLYGIYSDSFISAADNQPFKLPLSGFDFQPIGTERYSEVIGNFLKGEQDVGA